LFYRDFHVRPVCSKDLAGIEQLVKTIDLNENLIKDIKQFHKVRRDEVIISIAYCFNIIIHRKYLDNTSVLPTSIFIFDKFVDGAQPEVAGEIAGRRHILRTLGTVAVHVIMFY
jgi:hypothetical protein